ncbi:hypothetical protein RUND412_001446 [Rhizina undulata]
MPRATHLRQCGRSAKHTRWSLNGGRGKKRVTLESFMRAIQENSPSVLFPLVCLLKSPLRHSCSHCCSLIPSIPETLLLLHPPPSPTAANGLNERKYCTLHGDTAPMSSVNKKKKSNSSISSIRSRLTGTSAPTEPPSPAVSTVHASGTPTHCRNTNDSLSQSPYSLITEARSQNPSAISVASGNPPSAPVVPSSTLLPTSSKKKCDRNAPSNDNEVKTGGGRWFRGGTWPRVVSKAVTVTKVAQETVSREGSILSSSVEQGSSTMSRKTSEETLRPTEPPQPTYVDSGNPTMSQFLEAPPDVTPLPAVNTVMEEPTAEEQDLQESSNESEESKITKTEEPPAQQPTGGWFSWWYGQSAAPDSTEAPVSSVPEPEISKEPAKEPPVVEEVEPEHEEPTPTPPPSPPPPAAATEPTVYPELAEGPLSLDGAAESAPAPRPRSWFGFWGGYLESQVVQPEMEVLETPSELTTSAPSTSMPTTPVPPIPAPTPPQEPSAPDPPVAPTEQASPVGATSTESSTEPASRTSMTETAPADDSHNKAWFFWWGKNRPAEYVNSNNASTSTVGVVAVADESGVQSTQKVKPRDIPLASAKDAPPPSLSRAVTNLRDEGRPSTPKKSIASAPASSATAPGAPKPSPAATSSTTAKQNLQKILPANHLLPAFDSCYRRLDHPSLFCKMTRVFKGPPPLSKKHLYIAAEPHRPKKAVAIGVHGFFPMRLVRTVLGEPTGTSIRFANSAAAAIKRWAEKNGIEVEVEKIALEGEGKVGDRVEMLWKLLMNWMDHVRNADFVLMAAHSQGVVVGMQLLARLIEEGCVEKARIGFTAMAGINLGPFYHLPTSLLTGSAKELFEFQKMDSAVSRKYVQSLRTVLAHNVRILYVGSIDDQLVPMESSTFSNISHPYIYRAVFVDGRVHAPDFLSHLVGFTMKLRNLGTTDHGLIRELSSPLAGSLYGGEGHSRIYDDGAVYDLGVRHALETTACDGVPLRVDTFELPPNQVNPFILPWCLRGLLEETVVRTQLQDECQLLLEQFEAWKPTSKALKDVKWRLEGIRSKL